ncbi:MAG: PTS transporter subunit EIIC [Lachnospiraceae bacterium]|nr:PTS transporter subunit EIIC [Lachnospiraceae bacterium]
MKNRIGALISAGSGHLSACMAPLIPLITAGSLMKLVCLLLGMTGVLSGSTETILRVIGDTPFYFLPVLVSITAAGHFGADLFYSVGTACMLMMPDFVSMMGGDAAVSFIAVPVVRTTYAYNILPIILLTYLIARLEPAAAARFPKALKGTIYPLLVFTVTCACGFLVVGPLGTIVSMGFSELLTFLSVHAGVLAWALFACIAPLLIPAGMHWIFVTTAITQISTNGYDTGIMAAFMIANLTLAGADFAVCLRTRDKEFQSQALSAGIVALLSGVSEPSLFGVCLKEKKALRCVMAAGALAGIYEGIVTIKCYVYSFPAVCSILMFHGPEGMANLWKAIGLAALSVALGFVLTFFVLPKDSAGQAFDRSGPKLTPDEASQG